jgi:hypothetical protein
MVNLASEANAAKINQRFKELEVEILDMKTELKTMQNNLCNMQGIINKQTEMIQQAWVKRYSNGPTETDNG